MFELYSKVIIKSKQLVGTVVDISTIGGENIYVVESDTKEKNHDGYGGVWALYDCRENEIESVIE